MRFGKNAGWWFFKEDCNEPLEVIHQDKFTKRKSFFPNEFCASISKTTCSSGRQNRGFCENLISSKKLINGKSYQRENLQDTEKSWVDYGNIYYNFYYDIHILYIKLKLYIYIIWFLSCF